MLLKITGSLCASSPQPLLKSALFYHGEDFIAFSVLNETTFLCGGTDLKVIMVWPCSLHLVYEFTVG